MGIILYVAPKRRWRLKEVTFPNNPMKLLNDEDYFTNSKMKTLRHKEVEKVKE